MIKIIKNGYLTTSKKKNRRICCLCGSKENITRHHFIDKYLEEMWIKIGFQITSINKAKRYFIANFCEGCHKMIHKRQRPHKIEIR